MLHSSREVYIILQKNEIDVRYVLVLGKGGTYEILEK